MKRTVLVALACSAICSTVSALLIWKSCHVADSSDQLMAIENKLVGLEQRIERAERIQSEDRDRLTNFVIDLREASVLCGCAAALKARPHETMLPK